jgi:ABC-type nitrate/sulfonate/bicarbonate transport system substrate-binding protein
VDAKIVAAGGVWYSGWHLVVPKGSKITKLEDLEGKKVGIPEQDLPLKGSNDRSEAE